MIKLPPRNIGDDLQVFHLDPGRACNPAADGFKFIRQQWFGEQQQDKQAACLVFDIAKGSEIHWHSPHVDLINSRSITIVGTRFQFFNHFYCE